eukprot:g725.t1
MSSTRAALSLLEVEYEAQCTTLTDTPLKVTLARFYVQHNPEKLQADKGGAEKYLQSIVDHYANKPGELNEHLIKQYGEHQEMIESLKKLLGYLVLDLNEITVQWDDHIGRFHLKLAQQANCFDNTVAFIAKLKQHAPAIASAANYTPGQVVPTAERAEAKLLQIAGAHEVFEEKPAEAVVFMHNLRTLIKACEDAEEPPSYNFVSKMAVVAERVEQHLQKQEEQLTASSTKHYAEARKEINPSQRKAMLSEVTKCMERHDILRQKLVELGFRADDGADTILVAEIKREISVDMEATLEKLSSPTTCSLELVAKPAHCMYVTAIELADVSIFEHANSCIGEILRKVNMCESVNKFGLQELACMLTYAHDFPRGGEIIAKQPVFEDMRRRQFQNDAGSMTVKTCVKEMAELNGLTKAQQQELGKQMKAIYREYDAVVDKCRYETNLDAICDSVRDKKNDIPAMIGGVFAVWSMLSKSENCSTEKRPLSPQVATIVRLLGLDAQWSTTGLSLRGLRQWMSGGAQAIDASHLAQVKTGQGKSVILGTLATVLCLCDFHVDCVCYSQHLSSRDAQDFGPVFKQFGVQDMVSYSTFRQLANKLINEDGEVRALTKALFGHGGGSSSGHLSELSALEEQDMSGKADKGKRILLIDEVDVFFSRDFYGSTHNPTVHLSQHPEVADLQRT